MFTLTSDVEESSTRSEDISLDYDFFHSDLLELSCGGNYTARIIPKDINIWISRLFLGDADGFSILYYQDVDSLVYWANQAAYRWKLRGMCMWSPGSGGYALMGMAAEADLTFLSFWESATALRSGRFFHTQNQEKRR